MRGLRIPVATVVAMVADGMKTAEILVDLPDLEVEDVREALRYAAEEVRERHLPLRLSWPPVSEQVRSRALMSGVGLPKLRASRHAPARSTG